MRTTDSGLKLGVMLSCIDLGMVEHKAAHAQAAGYHCCQLSFRWDATPGEVVIAEETCARRGLEVAAYGAYANLLRPDDAAFHGITLRSVYSLIEAMDAAACRRLVIYSGTYGRLPADAHPGNASPEAWRTVRTTARDLATRLRAHGGLLCVEPHYAHVLNTPEDCLAFVAEVDPDVTRVVLDATNLIAPGDVDRLADLVPRIVSALAPVTEIIHLKDIAPRPGGGIALPAPGKGLMDYPGFLAAVREHNLAVPAIIEHIDENSAASMREAREFIEPHL